MGPRGSLLAGVLMVIALAFVGVLALGAMSASGLRLGSAHQRQAEADQLAETTVAHAVTRICQDPTWGTRSGDGLSVPQANGNRAELWFDAALAADLECEVSCNNLTGTASVTTADGLVVPPGVTLLIARARCGSVTHRLRVWVHFPSFNYAIASTGAVHVQSSEVYSIDPKHASDNPRTLPGDQFLPGGIASNATGGGAVSLVGSQVSGDAQACGLVDLDPASLILGEVRQEAPSLTLPHIAYDDFDLDAVGTGVQMLASSLPATTTLTGFNRSSGGLSITGVLRLDNAVVVVPGDLHVQGQLSGTGALIVGGQTTVVGTVDMSANDMVALVGRGDVTLSGQGGATFRGLVATQGNLRASNLTLIGLYLNEPPAGSGAIGEVTLQNVRAVRDGTVGRLLLPVEQTYSIRVGNGGYVWLEDSPPHPAGFLPCDVNHVPLPGATPLPPGPLPASSVVEILHVIRRFDPATRKARYYTDVPVFSTLILSSVVRTMHGDFSQLINDIEVSNPTLANVATWPMLKQGMQTFFGEDAPSASATAYKKFGTWDLNEFLSLQERARVLRWQKL